MNKNTRYNGGFDDFRVLLITAFVLGTITLLIYGYMEEDRYPHKASFTSNKWTWMFDKHW